MGNLSVIYIYTDENGEKKQGWALIEETSTPEEGEKFFLSIRGSQGVPPDAEVVNTRWEQSY
jgi:hypothetical protein